MDARSYFVVFCGLALEVCLVWRLLRKGMWRTFGYFFLYVLYVVLRTIILLGITWWVSARFATAFWVTEVIGLPLNFLVAWEVFRQTFPKGSSLNRIASKGFVLAGLSLAVFLIDAFWGFQAYAIFNSVYLALERSFGFAGAVLTLGLVLVARYYGVSLGRNVWGMAIGFGSWTSILTANNAMFDLDHSFIPFWRVLSPISSMAMFGIWIWAMWNYAPNPAPELEGNVVQDADLSGWTEDWNRTVSSARRIIHP